MVSVTALIDLGGIRFGRLVVLSKAGHKSGSIAWLCKCDCGKEKIISGANLRKPKNYTKSCGCINREVTSKRSIKHGMYGTPEYIAWIAAKERTTNPHSQNYGHWGGRGIRMCAEWLDSFQAFYNYIGPKTSPKHSLDRINVNGNYEPGNVRWATKDIQQGNKRKVSKLQEEIDSLKLLILILLLDA